MHSGFRVQELAKKKNASMAQVAIAWILSKEGVTAPIVGTTHVDNLLDIIRKYCFRPVPTFTIDFCN